ncbi:disease resistance protein RUN1-like [Telopea speciosissima]|uniref:disease resistance protein RUN1-like n=1 Tax=Telopea speciosissima TaxID=54955 RepID=UPI001CC3A0A1|nr:disease resistance protein RUN1-like [Telopea speciosissima]
MAAEMTYGAASSSFSSSSRQWKYDVFLSFCGQDTRTHFIDYLFNWLHRDGIHTFRDDNWLTRGENISSELMEAIEGSRIAIIVFSENYASSTWCLDELVKIIECKKDGRLEKVLPVFFKVEPSDVRHQRNTYEKAFKEHEESFKNETEKVNRWRVALKEAADLSGWDQEKIANGHEAELIKEIGEEVLTIVKPKCLEVAEHPIGLESHIYRIVCLLNDGKSDVSRIIGIYGLGGIGKTTIAKAVFKIMLRNFEGSVFLANVREGSKQKGLAFLQEQLLFGVLKRKEERTIYNEDEGINIIKGRLSCKRVLIVLDDVEETNQFYKLVGGHNCFGPGSRIILTTKNKHLLDSLDVNEKHQYRVETMNQNEFLPLFSLHAFRQNHPSEDYQQLSNEVIHYAGGLPLALVVLGSLLYNRNKVLWERELKNLRNIPNNKIFDILEIRYNALHEDDQTIFLDISCFFIGWNKNDVIKILDACDLGGEAGIELLTERSLVTIDEHNCLHMHDLIQEMGRQIVRKQSPKKPRGRSRLWNNDDAIDVLKYLNGIDAVEVLRLDLTQYNVKESGMLNTLGFSEMPNLRILDIHCFSGIDRTVDGATFFIDTDLEHSFQEGNFCFGKLLWFKWIEFPFEFIPNHFHLGKLVILHMPQSNLKEVWKETKHLPKLKELDLSCSSYLTRTPNFAGLPNLEKLNLSSCESSERY